MYWLQEYVIDWDKVQTVEDIKRVLMSLDIRMDPVYPGLQHLEGLVIRRDKNTQSMAVMD